MSKLPNYLTAAERAFWRSIWRAAERERRISERVLADMMFGKPAGKRRTRKAAP
ncbi:hypothetical protein [Burkholderia cenocepacia]|uniref:hypothetical protein n=1 Tax=Burkholderia cenocepacia TaxID=95486 RepID=UPI002875D1E2|nr:hypothetical protein [Burkholderia cenocepacia]MDS0801738.1 hypothetical protein [Burkholderia cenocepacia]